MKNINNNEKQLFEAVLEELKTRVMALTEKEDMVNPNIPGLYVYRQEQSMQLVSTLYEPSICVIVQGAKQIFLGDESLSYDPYSYLLASVNLPATIKITEASTEKPYLGFMLTLDRREISKLMIESSISVTSNSGSSELGLATGKMTLQLLEALKRLFELVNNPKDISVLAPLIQKEIIYRMLVGDTGSSLRRIASIGNQSNNIAKVIDWVKDNFAKPLRIEDLSEQACMSSSTFHHHFRSITAMSPIQYIKTLRLHEARRLMLAENQDASTASFNVGYESPSQFSREYKRMFGDSPQRDIKKLVGTTTS